MEKGKVVEYKPEGKWVKKKPQELSEGPNLIVRKVDGDFAFCDIVFWPRTKKV